MSAPLALAFPVMLEAFGLRLHPPAVFEALGYFLGFRAYLALRRRRGDAVPTHTRWSVIAGAALGGALGSKLLFVVEDPGLWTQAAAEPAVLLAGKSIVGGLLGGLIGVEVTKRAIGEWHSTGDLFAIPLCLGMAIGRIGCFLTGLADRTYGVATTLSWGVDFGDGVARHPTQLYEIAVLLVLAALLARLPAWRPLRDGDVFKVFMAAYLTFRLVVDAWKPGVPLAGLTAIQWACVAGLGYYARDMIRLALTWREGRPGHDAARSVA